MSLQYNIERQMIDYLKWCCWYDGGSCVSSFRYALLFRSWTSTVLTVPVDTIKVRMQLSRRARVPGVSWDISQRFFEFRLIPSRQKRGDLLPRVGKSLGKSLRSLYIRDSVPSSSVSFQKWPFVSRPSSNTSNGWQTRTESCHHRLHSLVCKTSLNRWESR